MASSSDVWGRHGRGQRARVGRKGDRHDPRSPRRASIGTKRVPQMRRAQFAVRSPTLIPPVTARVAAAAQRVCPELAEPSTNHNSSELAKNCRRFEVENFQDAARSGNFLASSTAGLLLVLQRGPAVDCSTCASKCM